eukprot:COSAG02_NODE_7214_length_3115_cov_1.606432_2_plen_71_part_00
MHSSYHYGVSPMPPSVSSHFLVVKLGQIDCVPKQLDFAHLQCNRETVTTIEQCYLMQRQTPTPPAQRRLR